MVHPTAAQGCEWHAPGVWCSCSFSPLSTEFNLGAGQSSELSPIISVIKYSVGTKTHRTYQIKETSFGPRYPLEQKPSCSRHVCLVSTVLMCFPWKPLCSLLLCFDPAPDTVEAGKRGRLTWYEGAVTSPIEHLTTKTTTTLKQRAFIVYREAVSKRKYSNRFLETINSHSSSKALPQFRINRGREAFLTCLFSCAWASCSNRNKQTGAFTSFPPVHSDSSSIAKLTWRRSLCI